MKSSTPSDSGVAASSSGSEGGPIMQLPKCVGCVYQQYNSVNNTKNKEECCKHITENFTFDAALEQTVIVTQRYHMKY